VDRVAKPVPMPRWACAIVRANAAERRFERWLAENIWDLTIAAIVVAVVGGTFVVSNALSAAILLGAVHPQGNEGLVVLVLTAAVDIFVAYVVLSTCVEHRYGDACLSRGDGA
jgi:hypothetical protein